jgi:phosphoglycolate phosphatase
MTYDAVLFDSDGVLVEPPSSDTLRRAARDVLEWADLNVSATTLIRSLRAGELARLERGCRNADVSLTSLCQRVATVSFRVQREEIERGLRSAYDDISALSEIPVPMGLVSDNQPQIVQYLLRRTDLEAAFDTVRCRPVAPRDLRRSKPSPDNLKAAMSDLDVSDPVYVGDRDVDVEAARRVGIDAVRVDRDRDGEATPDAESRPVQPTHVITSLYQLPEVVV